MHGEKNDAPASKGTASGSTPTIASGTGQRSRQVPSTRVPSPPPRNQTRVPTARLRLRSTTPLPSTPGTYGNAGGSRNSPRQIVRSRWPTLAASMRTMLKPSPPCGSGTVSSTGAAPHS